MVKAQPSSQYSAFLIGGIDDYSNAMRDIYAVPKDFKNFVFMGNLKTARYSHVAMVLPDELVEKCVD